MNALKLLPLSMLLAASAFAQGANQEQLGEAEQLGWKGLERLADSICGKIETGGSRLAIQGDVELKSEFDAWITGAEGGVAGTIDYEIYVGVLHEELGEEKKDARKCRLQIFGDLKGYVVSQSCELKITSSVRSGQTIYGPLPLQHIKDITEQECHQECILYLDCIAFTYGGSDLGDQKRRKECFTYGDPLPKDVFRPNPLWSVGEIEKEMVC